MELFDSIQFNFEEDNYDIRIYYDDVRINVLAFHKNHPANGYRYQIKIPNGYDVRNILEKFPINNLVEKCKSDIEEKSWEELNKIIQLNKIVNFSEGVKSEVTFKL